MSGATWWQRLTDLGDVTVVAVDLTANPQREAIALGLLDEAERSRYRRFRVEGARRRFLLSRGALRMIVGETIGVPARAIAFACLEHGKPYATVAGSPAPLAFNLSHSGRDALIALTPGRAVGIDLEHRRTGVDLDGVGARVFGRNERSALSAAAGPAKLKVFYRLWTCKEALIKARGTGFAYNPARFEVPPAMLEGASSVRFGFPDEASAPWILTDLGCERYAAAVAYGL